MQRSVIYARYSTDLQSDRSIEDQFALCQSFADREGYQVTQTFADRAKSSASMMGRDGLLDLMTQATKGSFDVVIVEALDRLSRDQEDLAGIHKRLQFAGIDILTVHEGKADAMQVGIRGLLGTMFLQDLKHKVRRGMQGVVRDGRNAGGRAYGYTPVPGQPGEQIIVEAEAEIIREIFDRYLEGVSPRSIAAELNARGIAPPRGQKWNASTINGNQKRGYGILHNPLYGGERIWNRVKMIRDPETGKRVSRVNPESEWMREPAPELAIVDTIIFEGVCKRFADRSKKHANGSSRREARIFSGLLKCGICGSGMSIHDKRGSAVRIRCSAVRESGSCTNKQSYRLDQIESMVFDQLSTILDQPAYLEEYLRTYREERRKLNADLIKNRAQIERKYLSALGTYNRTIDLYTNGTIDGVEGEQKILDAKSKLQAAKDELASVGNTPPIIELHPHAPARYANLVRNLGEQFQSGNIQFDCKAKEILRELVAEIVISPNENGASVEIKGKLAAILNDPNVELGGIGGSGGGT